MAVHTYFAIAVQIVEQYPLVRDRVMIARDTLAEDGQPRTPTGPYLCTGEMLLAIIGVFAISDVQPGQGSASDARQLLSRLGVERSAVFNPVVEQVRRSPADEQKLQL